MAAIYASAPYMLGEDFQRFMLDGSGQAILANAVRVVSPRVTEEPSRDRQPNAEDPR
jgi:hypothetical protein